MTTNGAKRRSGGRPKAEQDDLLIASLASGATHGEAAEAAGLARRTVTRRLGDPVFKAALSEARATIAHDVLTRTAELAGRAVDTLGELLSCDTPAVRLGAARAILTTAAEFGEKAELAERLAALEAVLNTRKAEANGAGH